MIASEWAAKFWVLADAWRDKRTDTALIRVIAWPSGEGDDAATAVATGFARHLYPLLRAYLPQRDATSTAGLCRFSKLAKKTEKIHENMLTPPLRCL